MNKTELLPADRFDATVYTKGAIVYVPHYLIPKMFVGPCGQVYNEATLKTYASPGILKLWRRDA